MLKREDTASLSALNPTGLIFYHGISQIDKTSQIVGIITLNSDNKKTGNMGQSWIIPDNNLSPVDNAREGSDFSVCGDCKHRPENMGSCYVTLFQAPLQIWKTYSKYKYPVIDLTTRNNFLYERPLRLGAYGDPVAIPFEVWESLLRENNITSTTGYTHQWNNCDQRFKFILMASVDSKEELSIVPLFALLK